MLFRGGSSDNGQQLSAAEKDNAELDKALRQRLAELTWDELECDLITAKVVDDLLVDSQSVALRLTFGYPFATVAERYKERLSTALVPLIGERELTIGMRSQIVPHANQQSMPAKRGIKNIIAVSSAKGGVGKSTTCVNLALALHREGARVGILDTDITGPSQPMMLGVPEGIRPKVREEKYFVPVPAHGIATMSMGYMMNNRQAVIWRGPMVSGGMEQMMNQTLWGELDYLILDLPPSTSDLQLSLVKKVPLAGAIIVTTPQEIALLDAVRGIEMFGKMDISVLGIVENMAMHICSNCGHAEAIFGDGGGEQLAEDYDTRLLGSLPLSRQVREQSDKGDPIVVADPDSDVAGLYHQLARRMAAQLSQRAEVEMAFPKVVTEG